MTPDSPESAGAVISAFARVASAIIAGRRRDEVFTVIAASVRRLVDADMSAVSLRLDDTHVLTVAHDGVDAEHYRGKTYSVAGTTTEEVLRTGRTVVIGDLSERDYIRQRTPEADVGPAIFVPIVIVDGPRGSLSVSRRRGGERFTEGDVALITSFAGQAAMVLERDIQRRRSLEIDRVADQSRFAADLNDNAVGEIFEASLLVSRLASEATGDIQRDTALRAIAGLDHAIKLIRQAAFGLTEQASAKAAKPAG